MLRLRRLLGSADTFTPTLVACYAITAVSHVASVGLQTLLPFHVVALGGSPTQVGLLFSVMTVASMVLRPGVGGLVDRLGARRVIVPGAVALGLTSLALHVAAGPRMLLVLAVGLGVSYALIFTPASIVTATASPPEHRGEALGTYYLASSLAIAAGPPVAFGLRAVGGMSIAFAAITVLALILVVIAMRLPGGHAARPVARASHFAFVSRGALGVSAAVVLATLGHTSVYGFLPLYAVSRGQGAALVLFFTVYALWIIACRVLFRGVSDRLGHVRVALVASTLVAVAYAVLAWPPTVATLTMAAVLLGTGRAVLYPTVVALVVERTGEAERGLALGTLASAWDLGVVIGSALIGLVADRFSYGAGFAVGAAGAALGTIALAVSESRIFRPRFPRPASW